MNLRMATSYPYIWTKQVAGAKLTYDCTDENDPVLFPGWRGVLDFAELGLSVNGTNHNTAIKGYLNILLRIVRLRQN